MTLEKPDTEPHRRFNPLTREWVLVSPHRTQRPWRGQRRRLTLLQLWHMILMLSLPWQPTGRRCSQSQLHLDVCFH